MQLLTTNVQGQPLQSHAEFLTDRDGNADLATEAPASGTYRHADPTGLFWSLCPAGTNTAALILKDLGPVRYKLTAMVNGHTVATATIERNFLSPGVRRIRVHDQGLRGTLFLPTGNGPWPGVIILGGSEGGLGPWTEAEAACLAAKGYAAFALAYFDYEDLPKSLENIPLEYFQSAIHLLQARDDIRSNSIAVLGGSRGGELALLLGATFPEIHAVVAISAGSVLWGGLGTNSGAVRHPAWTYQGQALPFMERRDYDQFDGMLDQNPFDTVQRFQAALDKYPAVAKASIPVEKINGPVLLISGINDKMSPSTQMEDMVMIRLKEARHAFPDCHFSYSGAGHIIFLPNLPTASNFVIRWGGDPEHTAAAAADSWPRIVEFLDQTLNVNRH